MYVLIELTDNLINLFSVFRRLICADIRFLEHTFIWNQFLDAVILELLLQPVDQLLQRHGVKLHLVATSCF